MYKIMKCDITTGEWFDYGAYDESDMKLIVRGYHNNGLFYEKSNSNTIYTVQELECNPT